MRPATDIFCLQHQSGWVCRHSGACCSAGWTIPIEGPAFARVGARFGPTAAVPLFRTGGPLPEGAAAALASRDDGSCVFFDAGRGRLCAIHRELGPGSLPSACRQFPRQALKDARGTLVSLSHYCPTNAALTLSAGPLCIVPAPPNLALDDLEGLDATDVLPPLLEAEMLTDTSGYDAWERLALDAIDGAGGCAADAIGRIASATARVTHWRPGAGSLIAVVSRAFAIDGGERWRLDPGRARALANLARESVPAGLEPPDLPVDPDEGWDEAAAWLREYDRAVRAYLAARLFGNWIAYYGNGLSTIVDYLRVCLAVLTTEALRYRRRDDLDARQQLIEALRSSDLLLVHQADVRTLARLLSRI